MAAFIPIFIIEKVGRRPLMLFGVCPFLISRIHVFLAYNSLRLLACPSPWLSLQAPTTG